MGYSEGTLGLSEGSVGVHWGSVREEERVRRRREGGYIEDTGRIH